MDSDDILKALTPFPGIALWGEVCGAIVGSCLMGERISLHPYRPQEGFAPKLRRNMAALRAPTYWRIEWIRSSI